MVIPEWFCNYLLLNIRPSLPMYNLPLQTLTDSLHLYHLIVLKPPKNIWFFSTFCFWKHWILVRGDEIVTSCAWVHFKKKIGSLGGFLFFARRQLKKVVLQCSSVHQLSATPQAIYIIPIDWDTICLFEVLLLDVMLAFSAKSFIYMEDIVIDM